MPDNKQQVSLLGEIERDLLDGVAVSDILRKLVIFGGRVGSSELRDWASNELRGYKIGDELPRYRKISALVQLDSVIYQTQTIGQTISILELPEVARDKITAYAPIYDCVAQVQAYIETCSGGGVVKIMLPQSAEIARLMERSIGDPGTHITAIYWSTTPAALIGLLDQVKTRLAELLSELRSSTASDAEMPTATQTDKAVNIVLSGDRNQINVSTSQDDRTFWTSRRTIGAIVVGVATVAAAVFGGIQAFGG